jgi:glycosyltransferase involved in cell wall biosynthesis
MRIGSNPLHHSTVSGYEPVVFAVITHLPNTLGYHEKRLEVIQKCIWSMTKNAPPHTLIIWDNGSCEALRQWIRYIKPDIFIESPNVGKATARASIFRMVPPDSLVAMSDDDILYYPGWFEEQVKVLDTFPNVSCVTGNPIRTSFRWGCENTIEWMNKQGILEVGRFIPDNYERDFCISIGRDPMIHKKNTVKDVDYRGLYNGVYAYATSHHCQFMSIAGRVLPAMRFDNQAMGDEKPFDMAMDKIGLRLSTVQRYSRHIGNVIHDELRKEIHKIC